MSLHNLLSHSLLWEKIRERKILSAHRKTADICRQLMADYAASPLRVELRPKKTFPPDRLIVWQYWAQGYEDVPPIVKECLDSVSEHCRDCTVVRLTDQNLAEYLDLPDFVRERRSQFSRAFFSDLLRLMLLRVYGGLWLDATIMMTGPVPEAFGTLDFFVYRRDPDEPCQKYWKNTYAYYFGWAKGFRVNMLSSIMYARPGSLTVQGLCDLLLFWWKTQTTLPDYFFLQILFDVYQPRDAFPLVSDCIPHYLQKSMDDPEFSIMSREEIIRDHPFHKMTYKVG